MISITSPTLLLDENKCRNNIKRISIKLEKNNISFRPHFKTHQSLKVGEWFKEKSIAAITVSSVKMAKHFAQAGWMDITIAFPVNIREIDEINKLGRTIKLGILVSDPQTVSRIITLVDTKINVWIEIDTGDHRSGFSLDNFEIIKETIEILNSSDNIDVKGFLSHSGITYSTSSTSEIEKLHNNSIVKLNQLRDYLTVFFPGLLISFGDTPSFSIVNKFQNFDEGRPGNFVFYDMMQFQLGACSIDDIAVAMVCPVVAKYQERGEIIIYGGAVHFSKEYIIDKQNRKSFGRVVKLNSSGWVDSGDKNYLAGLSQEHGIVKLNNKMMKEVEVGDLIGILPIHSCLTASCMKGFLTLDGKSIDHLEGLNKY